ncbi:MAG: hypothetical protein ABMA13_23110 [Chthoniobacteraceae bacterium]
MRFSRRPKAARELADYRQVADAVQARRQTRVQTTQPATGKEVRSYKPAEQLESLAADVKQYQRDCEGMPRDWQREEPQPFLRFERAIAWGAIVLTTALLSFWLVMIAIRS